MGGWVQRHNNQKSKECAKEFRCTKSRHVQRDQVMIVQIRVLMWLEEWQDRVSQE